MYYKEVLLVNPSGLHARPASDFVNCAKRYKSKITVENAAGDATANAKSIVLLLGLGLTKGDILRVKADGEDEQEAVQALVQLVNEGFNEV